jgi:murein DD-endopeptidase MepM/ murein hydrolase activator NlpD
MDNVPIKGVQIDSKIEEYHIQAPPEGFCGPIMSWYRDQNTIKGTQRTIGGAHNGLDLAGPVGRLVVAAAPGVVAISKADPTGNAWTVYIDHGSDVHGNRVYSVYGHLKPIQVVKYAQLVKRGQLIGYSGDNGQGTGGEGPHLHFGVSLRPHEKDADGKSQYGTASPIPFIWNGGKPVTNKDFPTVFPAFDPSVNYDDDANWLKRQVFNGLTFPMKCDTK